MEHFSSTCINLHTCAHMILSEQKMKRKHNIFRRVWHLLKSRSLKKYRQRKKTYINCQKKGWSRKRDGVGCPWSLLERSWWKNILLYKAPLQMGILIAWWTLCLVVQPEGTESPTLPLACNLAPTTPVELLVDWHWKDQCKKYHDSKCRK